MTRSGLEPTIYRTQGEHANHYTTNVVGLRQEEIVIGYYTVLCTIWKDIVRVCIVLKTRIGQDAIGVESNTGFQYNTDEYNIFPFCT